jgi:hypothetical protein
MRQRLIDNGFEPVGGPPEKAGEKIHSEIAKWAPVVKAAASRSTSMAEPMGLLVAGMNYSPVGAEEYNAWYDTEHVP